MIGGELARAHLLLVSAHEHGHEHEEAHEHAHSHAPEYHSSDHEEYSYTGRRSGRLPRLDLDMKVHKEFTITEKALTKSFSCLKMPRY